MIYYYACKTCGEIGKYNRPDDESTHSDLPPQELIRHFHSNKPGIRMGFRTEREARRWLERHKEWSTSGTADPR